MKTEKEAAREFIAWIVGAFTGVITGISLASIVSTVDTEITKGKPFELESKIYKCEEVKF
jgi:hypothetical protein